jgi:PIN domain nuclease of toxin-antitoxin system
MRSYLLDTHVVIWMDESRGRILEETWDLLEGGGRCFYSAASAWEASIKRASGKLRISGSLSEASRRLGLTALPITVAHGEAAGELPPHHGDPFDRLLVAQARMEGLVLVTKDRLLQKYEVTLLLV